MEHLTSQNKRKKRKNFFKKTLAVHTKITLAFFIFYLLASLVVDPRFLLSDFRDKYSSIAATSQVLLSVHVVGPPGKPAPIANWFCDDSGSYIQLDWAATEDTTSYDIYKDSVLLAADISELTYRDDIITDSNSYTYRVVANGPLGSTSSDEISQTAGTCEIRPTPNIQIKYLDGKNIENRDIPEPSKRNPIFSGTTSISNAIITVSLGGDATIQSSTTANSNGYWEWRVPISLHDGDYQVIFTATDPGDDTYSATATKNFRIVQNEQETKKESKKINPLLQEPASSTISLSFGISVAVENFGRFVFAGQDLIFRLNILKKDTPIPNRDYKVSYMVVDSDGKSVLEVIENINPAKNQTIEKNIEIPPLTKNGNYKIVARIYQGNNVISGDDFFSVRELPIFAIGTISITPLVVMQNLGWLLLILLIILLLFMILLGIEHYLSQEAVFQITDEFLEKEGLITKRKEANK